MNPNHQEHDHIRSKVILVDSLSQGLECVNECIPRFLAHETPDGIKELIVLTLGLEDGEANAVKTGDMKLRKVAKDAMPFNGPAETRTEQLNFQLGLGLRYTDPDLIIARCRDSLSERLINHAVPSGHVVYLICDEGESVDELIMAAKKNAVSFDRDELMSFIDVIDQRKGIA